MYFLTLHWSQMRYIHTEVDKQWTSKVLFDCVHGIYETTVKRLVSVLSLWRVLQLSVLSMMCPSNHISSGRVSWSFHSFQVNPFYIYILYCTWTEHFIWCFMVQVMKAVIVIRSSELDWSVLPIQESYCQYFYEADYYFLHRSLFYGLIK